MPLSLPYRIGHGYDLHRLKAGGRLMLGGICVSEELSPISHSDGDVLLHAIVDALLGALALGDIGEHFSNTDPQWKDAPSRVFVEDSMAKVTSAGYRVQNADVTIIAERPKLKAFKPQMAKSVAGLLQIETDQVNIKAGTNEGCDAIGSGEAIAAHAVILLAKSGLD
ncbi:MAG TPA: 2-C-methyl-D-erythritol 2,4-cyclodiphosphate synthase [Tepidisphaeraceae bacterium]|nr:2-C-methyl-D-erythritol 2,4-cyclodiphosphate synthase [Tepidisphaeraceae bacterium]